SADLRPCLRPGLRRSDGFRTWTGTGNPRGAWSGPFAMGRAAWRVRASSAPRGAWVPSRSPKDVLDGVCVEDSFGPGLELLLCGTIDPCFAGWGELAARVGALLPQDRPQTFGLAFGEATVSELGLVLVTLGEHGQGLSCGGAEVGVDQIEV